jgi:hypothetical protein
MIALREHAALGKEDVLNSEGVKPESAATRSGLRPRFRATQVLVTRAQPWPQIHLIWQVDSWLI